MKTSRGDATRLSSVDLARTNLLVWVSAQMPTKRLTDEQVDAMHKLMDQLEKAIREAKRGSP